MWEVHDDGTVWWPFLAGLVWVALVAVIGLLIYRAITRDKPQIVITPPLPPEPEALSIARRRYAAGEIDRDEYLRILADLERPSQPV